MSAVRELADLVQDAIDRGAKTVEEIHRSIADLPLKVLEEVQFLKKPIRQIRKVQDQSIGAVYDLIREINKRVGELAGNMLGKQAKTAAVRKASTKVTRKLRGKA